MNIQTADTSFSQDPVINSKTRNLIFSQNVVGFLTKAREFRYTFLSLDLSLTYVLKTTLTRSKQTSVKYIWIPTYFLFSMYDKSLLSIFLRALITAGCHNLFMAILKMLPSSLSKSTRICMSKATQWGQKISELAIFLMISTTNSHS